MNHFMTSIFLILTLQFTGVSSSLALADDSIFVIAGKNSSLPQITATDLKLIYLGQKSSLAGKPILIGQNESIQESFYATFTDKDMTAINQLWGIVIFTGKTDPPKNLKSDSEVIKFVNDDENAIGYVSKQPEGDSARVLAIQKSTTTTSK
ncbi:MAG: hypothetical protein HQK50_06310 [Oligoflexia bacterium]|nr:hypothetical protein [Oligoflexia bacterium]MBF0365164.1 hypothetical protein [Oligoflexia bacterium]